MPGRGRLMLVAVTGGAGFLGVHLARRLVGAGQDVRILDTSAKPGWADALGVEHLDCDVRDDGQVHRGIEGADVVVHAAFASPRAGAGAMHDVNVTGTDNVLAAARSSGISQVVLISSTIVDRPARSTGVLRRSGLARLNDYRTTRAAAEAAAAAHRRSGLSVAVVRPKTFVGAERVGAFAIVFELIRRGAVVPVPGSGRNRYQLLDIGDFAVGLHLLTTKGGDGLFHFGASEFGTVGHDIQALVDHAGSGARIRWVPEGLARSGVRTVELVGLSPLSEWYHCGARGEDSVVDISRAVAELGWRPEKSNAQSLVDAYDWFDGRRAQGGSAPTTHPVPLTHRILSGAVRTVLR